MQKIGAVATSANSDYAARLYGETAPTPQKDSTTVSIELLETFREEWIASGIRANLSPRTSIERRNITDKLIWFLKNHLHAECGTKEVEAFFDYCQTAHQGKLGRWDGGKTAALKDRPYKPLAPATLKTYYNYLKGFFSYLVRRKVIDESPLRFTDSPRGQDDKPTPFTQTQIEALLCAAKDSPTPFRNEAIIYFLLDTGVRVSELCGIKLSDVDFSDERSLCVQVLGKGRKKRTVRLGRDASAALWRYFKKEHGIRRRVNKIGKGERSQIDGSTPMFMSIAKANFGEALTRSGVLQMISKLGDASRIGGVRCSPHTFRHTFAITFLRNGGDVFALKEMLGHSNLRTVEIYLKLAQADVIEQHRKFSPGDSLRHQR